MKLMNSLKLYTRSEQDWACKHFTVVVEEPLSPPPIPMELLTVNGSWGRECHFLSGIAIDKLSLLL